MRDRGAHEQSGVVKRALIAPVPATQLCEICNEKKAPERHFVTIPLPRGFMRICDADMVKIKKVIRERVQKQVEIVFIEAKAKSQKKTPWP